MARCLPEFALPEIEQLVLAPISSLPDEPFFDVIALFLRNVDAVFFNDGGLQEPIVIHIRLTLANRLMASSGWKRLGRSRSTSIERHIGPAIATLFFNDYSFIQAAKCYLLPKGVDQLDPFLPMLKKLVEGGGPSLFVAIVTLNLLEVSPRSPHLSFMVASTKVWLESYLNDSDFWVDHGIGRRVCVWIAEARRWEPSLLGTETPIRFDVDRLLAALISFGVADARRLEEVLASGAGTGE